MRTTLSIDDDVLEAALALAKERRQTVGAVISALAGQALGLPLPTKTRTGFPLLPRRGAVVTLELVNALRDDDFGFALTEDFWDDEGALG